MRIALAVLLLASCAPRPADDAAGELLCCGGGEVYLLELGAAPRKVWSWRAADSPELPEALRSRFGSTDECKPVEGGAKVLITSSGGAVALVERATRKALFWAAVVNAHSAEILPGGRVAVAGSYGEGGNCLKVFDLAVPEKPIHSEELYGAHGFVWDAGRARLWALGERELRAYRLEPSGPVRDETHPLPDPGGHDLRPVPGRAELLVTTGKAVWLFDRDRKSFAPHPELGSVAHVKSVDIHPRTGRFVYVQGEKSWWAERVKFLGGEEIPRPGERLYKARWWVDEPAARYR